MKKNKYGFTMIELLAVITILGILTFIAVPAVSHYYTKAKLDSYENLEKTIKSSATNYITENDKYIPSTIGGKVEVTLRQLIDKRYSEDIIDLDKRNKKCDYDKSKVTITREDAGTINNIKLKYDVCLVCTDYSSDICEK